MTINDWVVHRADEQVAAGFSVARFRTAEDAALAQQAVVESCLTILRERGFVGAVVVACDVETTQGNLAPSVGGTIMVQTVETVDMFTDFLAISAPHSKAHILSLQTPPAEGGVNE